MRRATLALSSTSGQRRRATKSLSAAATSRCEWAAALRTPPEHTLLRHITGGTAQSARHRPQIWTRLSKSPSRPQPRANNRRRRSRCCRRESSWCRGRCGCSFSSMCRGPRTHAGYGVRHVGLRQREGRTFHICHHLVIACIAVWEQRCYETKEPPPLPTRLNRSQRTPTQSRLR